MIGFPMPKRFGYSAECLSSEKGAIERLFDRFDRHLEDRGLLALGGQIMDASVIEAP